MSSFENLARVGDSNSDDPVGSAERGGVLGRCDLGGGRVSLIVRTGESRSGTLDAHLIINSPVTRVTRNQIGKLSVLVIDHRLGK